MYDVICNRMSRHFFIVGGKLESNQQYIAEHLTPSTIGAHQQHH